MCVLDVLYTLMCVLDVLYTLMCVLDVLYTLMCVLDVLYTLMCVLDVLYTLMCVLDVLYTLMCVLDVLLYPYVCSRCTIKPLCVLVSPSRSRPGWIVNYLKTRRETDVLQCDSRWESY